MEMFCIFFTKMNVASTISVLYVNALLEMWILNLRPLYVGFHFLFYRGSFSYSSRVFQLRYAALSCKGADRGKAEAS